MKPEKDKKQGVSAVIVAAGSGTRMGGISKPEIVLGGKPLLIRVLDAFLQSEVTEIVIVCGSNRQNLEALVPNDLPKPVKFCDGGKTRTESVFYGVDATDRNNVFVCVHDCARPFVTPEIIETVVSAAKEQGAATACHPVTDTVKYVDTEHSLIYTPKRQYLLAIQTPQVFRKDQYTVAYALASKAKEAYTDETAMLEAAGVKVAYPVCPASNRKITTKEDLQLARAMLFLEEQERKKEQS